MVTGAAPLRASLKAEFIKRCAPSSISCEPRPLDRSWGSRLAHSKCPSTSKPCSHGGVSHLGVRIRPIVSPMSMTVCKKGSRAGVCSQTSQRLLADLNAVGRALPWLWPCRWEQIAQCAGSPGSFSPLLCLPPLGCGQTYNLVSSAPSGSFRTSPGACVLLTCAHLPQPRAELAPQPGAWQHTGKRSTCISQTARKNPSALHPSLSLQTHCFTPSPAPLLATGRRSNANAPGCSRASLPSPLTNHLPSVRLYAVWDHSSYPGTLCTCCSGHDRPLPLTQHPSGPAT